MRHIVGTKIRSLREELELTQEELAQAVGLSSEFISLLELGKRDPSLESLSSLARFFKKDLSYFLVERPDDLNVLLEKKDLSPAARRILRQFKNHCEDYLRLEELSERPLRQAPIYSSLSAQKMAAEERRRIDLGLEPILDMCVLAERNGLRIVRADLPESEGIAGIYVYYESRQAAFVLLNSIFSFPKLNFAAAHAYCHYLKDRYDGPIIDTPDMLVEDYVSLYPGREQFAHRFAVNFLIPPGRVRDIISREIRLEALRNPDVYYLRRYFGVDLAEMARFLEHLGFISGRMRNMLLKEDHMDAEEAFFGRGKPIKAQKSKKIVPSDRFKSLALSAFQRGRIDIQSLAGYLGQNPDKILPFVGQRS